jgi:crotonobetainyl-CoA:carnitine CoA-transferase CaiB-like acyl-CoA transferase
MRFSATPVDHSVPPPLLGEHTREVLGGVLGLGAAEIDALARAGVV